MRILLLLLPLVAVALAQDVVEGDVLSEATPRVVETETPKCEDECRKSYKETTEDAETANNLKACDYGCRMLTILDSIPFTQDANQAKGECENDCNHAHEREDERYACRIGCGFGVPAVAARRAAASSQAQMGNPLESLFGNLPRIRIAVPIRMSGMMPSMEGMMPSMGGMIPSMGGMMPSMPSGMGSIFSKMHGEMGKMMQSLSSQLEKIENGEIPEGSGRLVVVKSGPGYHNQKTYNFGPEGMDTKTEERTSSDKEKAFEKDMMSRSNPLERFFNLEKDVELVEPTKTKQEEKAVEQINNPFLLAKNALESFMSESDAEMDRESEIKQAIINAIEQSEGIRNINNDPYNIREIPRMSSGLRPAHGAPEVFYSQQALCAQRSSDMKWSDWVTCLHLRMGLPRWLTAATISLGIVFVIWLCLVIPQNAPKQKMKKFDCAKALEADQICFNNVLMDYKEGEMPPPKYEDIADLHVAIAISASESKRLEAEASAVKEDKA